LRYSSRHPFDFDAGGKGADLLRMKVFSERYGFDLNMASTRCRFIPQKDQACPGNIDDCEPCHNENDCFTSGGTTFMLLFPSVPENGHPPKKVEGPLAGAFPTPPSD
jgi:hypothetical protein